MLKGFVYQVFIVFFVLLGTSCQNTCKDARCEFGSYCHEGECICNKWYSGEHCHLFYNRNYGGTFEGTLSIASSRSLDSLVVTPDREVPNRLHTSLGVYLDFENDTLLLIPNQTITNDSDTFVAVGTGRYTLDNLYFNYERVHPEHSDISISVSFTGNLIKEDQAVE